MDNIISAAWDLLEKTYDNVDLYFYTTLFVIVVINGETVIITHTVSETDTAESVKASIDAQYEYHVTTSDLLKAQHEDFMLTQGFGSTL